MLNTVSTINYPMLNMVLTPPPLCKGQVEMDKDGGWWLTSRGQGDESKRIFFFKFDWSVFFKSKMAATKKAIIEFLGSHKK